MKDRRKNRDGKGLGRREFLKVSLAAGASLAAPMIFTRHASAQEERVLKIVQWKHFVPDYDKWFDTFAKEFGEKNKCKVEVDYVATADLPTAIAADISRRGGHDVFHLNGTGAWLYDNVSVVVVSFKNKHGREFGGWIPGASGIAEVRGKWLCIPHWFIRYPFIIHRGYFKQVGADYNDK